MDEYKNEIEMLFNQYIGDFDFTNNKKKRYLYCPLGCQGYSKNKHGHFEVNFELGVCYCYKCIEGSTIYSVIKQLKNNENRVYINNLLKNYFEHYSYEDIKNNKKNNLENKNNYNFTLDNVINKELFNTLSENQMAFLHYRFPTLNIDKIKKLINIFNFIPENNSDNFYYKSYFNKYKYFYILNNETFSKMKQCNNLIENDKIDYYFYNVSGDNLYISEGIVDLMTLYIHDPILNIKNSNLLALCSRNYNNIFEFLLNSGHFYYKNIYLLIDNDVNKENFIKGIINKLNKNKFKLFKNFYLLEVPKQFVDLNHLYLNDLNINNILINKLII